MEIEFKEVPRPMVTSFTVFEKLDINKLKKEKTIRITPKFVTKTRLSTSLQLGQFRAGLNWKIDGYKTDKVTKNNYMHSRTETSHYFKVLKSQPLEKYREYLKEMLKQFIDNLNIEIDKLIVEIEPIKTI